MKKGFNNYIHDGGLSMDELACQYWDICRKFIDVGGDKNKDESDICKYTTNTCVIKKVFQANLDPKIARKNLDGQVRDIIHDKLNSK